jgi:hypothetical protein
MESERMQHAATTSTQASEIQRLLGLLQVSWL